MSQDVGRFNKIFKSFGFVEVADAADKKIIRKFYSRNLLKFFNAGFRVKPGMTKCQAVVNGD